LRASAGNNPNDDELIEPYGSTRYLSYDAASKASQRKSNRQQRSNHGLWHLAFVALVILISARGLNRGIEAANRIRGPGLLLILCILVGYAVTTGDVER
jgi:SNF family Na+-dependent transporter